MSASTPNMANSGPGRPLNFKESSTRMSMTLRTFQAYEAEGDVVLEATKQTKRFVRAFEMTVFDGAILVNDANISNLPDDPSERTFELLSRSQGGLVHRNAILVDIKTFLCRPEVRRNYHLKRKGRFEGVLIHCDVFLTQKQYQECQALIIASTLSPEWVAVVPRPYFPLRRDVEMVPLAFGGIATGMAQAVPLPPALAAFIIPVSLLGQALDSIANHAERPEIPVRNPFTGLAYERCLTWVPTLSFPDELFTTSNEFRIRHRMWQAFKQAGKHTGYSVHLPTFAPITSDIRIDYNTGSSTQTVSVFLELKFEQLAVVSLSHGRRRLEHSARMQGSIGSPTFVFNAAWDYLLSFSVRNPDVGYLFRKDEIPQTFWHRTARAEDNHFLSHEYPDDKFLLSRLINFKASQERIVASIYKVMAGTDQPMVPPQRSGLSASQILAFAGPCPAGWLIQDEGGTTTGEEPSLEFDVMEANHAIATNAIEAGDDPDAINAGGEGVDEERMQGNYMNTVSDQRTLITGGMEMIRETQVFNFLSVQSRHKGQGCPIFLGHHSPWGSIGFIQYQWSDIDKAKFDKLGQLPCWIGSLSNDVVMVTLFLRYTRWRQRELPDEGTPIEVEYATNAFPCLLVCSPYPRETNHLLQALWVIPSEFVLKTHMGKLINPTYNRGPFILKNQYPIDSFRVDIQNFHSIVLNIVTSPKEIDIGLSQVRVDNTKYLRSIGQFRRMSDVDYATLFAPRRIRRDVQASQGAEDSQDAEESWDSRESD